MNKHFNLWTVSFKNTARATIVNCVCASPITGLCHGQTVGRWGLSGVFSLHLWEEHPQCVPHSCSGLHQQATAARQTQPDPPPVQTPAAPVQQVRAPLLHLKKGEGQELFGNVSGELHPPYKKSYTIPCALVWGRGVCSDCHIIDVWNPSSPPKETPFRTSGRPAVLLVLSSSTVHMYFQYCILLFKRDSIISRHLFTPCYQEICCRCAS